MRSISGDSGDWFGVFCRFGGFNTDTYVGSVGPDGSWTIRRTSLGDHYVKRTLAEGRVAPTGTPFPPGAVAHIRLDCLGQAEVTLRLSVNGTVVGTATDPVGLAPGNVGMAGSSTVGLVFDNLLVTEAQVV